MAKQRDLSTTATVNAAIALAEKTSATAEALATAKVASDIATAVLHTDIGYIKTDIGEIKTTLKELSARDGLYVLKDDFTFWRNLLVSGLLLSIAIGVVMNLIKN